MPRARQLTPRRRLQEGPRGHGAWHRRLVADQKHGCLLLLRGLLLRLLVRRLVPASVGKFGGGYGRLGRRGVLPALGGCWLGPQGGVPPHQMSQGHKGPA